MLLSGRSLSLVSPSGRASTLTRGISLLRDKGFIDGEWVSAKSGESFEVTNPADGSTLARVASMDRGDVTAAITSASESFECFRRTTAKERANFLRKWYDLMVSHADELALILTRENGKSLAESRGEIKYGNSFVEWFSEEARRVNGEVLQAPAANRELFLIKQPVGVAALITPWNFPHAMITRKAGAAIAAGCTCVLKPSEDTPLTALALAALAEEAEIPRGVLNVVPVNAVNSAGVGKELCADSRVRALSFTGSTKVGKMLYEQCAPSMKRLSLELGGNAPYIVFESADLELAVSGAMTSKFRNTGQTCVSANRFYVQDRIYENFLEKFVARVRADIRLGDGTAEGVTHGPLIKESQLRIVDSLVKDAVAKGAEIHCGGGIRDDLGPLFYEPTILTDVNRDMDIWGREIFGPVAVIHRFSAEPDVLKLANETRVGLAGYFFSRDVGQIFRVARNMEVGMVGVNEGLISCAEAAFGGVKESGLGREGSRHGLDDYLDIKYVCIGNLTR